MADDIDRENGRPREAGDSPFDADGVSDCDNERDRMFDRNLREFGRRVGIPEPTRGQQSRWQAAPSAATMRTADVPCGAGVLRSGGRRRTLALFSSALAAGIALAVFLVTPRGATVEAGTILRSLRQTLLDGFEINFKGIGENGVFADGRLAVALRPRSGTSAAHMGVDPSALAEFEVESLYAEVNLRGDLADAGKSGLDWQAILALGDGAQWAYIRAHGLPNWTFKDQPLACTIVGLTSNGLLVDFGERRLLKELRERERVARASDQVQTASQVRGGAARLVKDFLVGRAGAEQIDHVLALIAQTAREIQLREVEPGLYILRVSRFNLDSLASGEAEKLAAMTLEVRYRQGQGIESALLEHLGQYDGTLRLAPLADGIEPLVLAKRQELSSGPVTVWDVSAIQPLLERCINGRH